MSRSSWKGPFFKGNLLLKLNKNTVQNSDTGNVNNKNTKEYIIYNKSLYVNPILVDQKIRVYNGKFFQNIKITKQHIGHRIGNFVFTRKIFDKGKDSKFKKNWKARKKVSTSLLSKRKKNLLSKKRYRYRSLKVLKLI